MTSSIALDNQTEPKTSRAFHIGAWVAQGFLAFAFLGAGVMKLTTPIDQLVLKGMGWAATMPPGMVRFIGAAEFLGALGLILPAATRVQPKLTPAAAVGLATVMVLGAITHISRGEMSMIMPSIVLGSIASFIAYARLRKAPITARG